MPPTADLRQATIGERRIAAISHRIFYKVDLAVWVYRTIEKYRGGISWRSAWLETYREIGGVSTSSGQKSCPMTAAKKLYELGRLKGCSLPLEDREIPELWKQSRNGTYAILAVRLLRANPRLNKALLWREIQRAVRQDVGEEPACTNQGEPTLAFQLWHLGLIVEVGE